MMTIEVYTRPGTFTAAKREELGRRILTELIAGDSAPEVVLDTGRALTNVLFHEPATWVTNGDEPRYLVRMTVPGSWHTRSFGAYMIPRLTEILASTEDDPERLLREPHCQVQIVGLKE